MKAGVKVGPDSWREIFSRARVECCEIWFRLDWKERYSALFEYLRKEQIAFGLHFWAMVDGKYFPNLLSLESKEIAEKSYELIKKTINIASSWGARYVNFHPESYKESLLDLDNEKIRVLNPDKPIKREKSFVQFLDYLKKIKSYADERGVIPFVETVPRYMPSSFSAKGLNEEGRLNVQKSEGLETEKFIRMVELGYPVCLDIGHTLGQLITEDKERLFGYLYKAAKKMLPTVGLVHVNTNLSPFNGVDSHHGVLEEDFELGVVPNKQQLVKFFSLFKGRDVWFIPEPPIEKMVDNHFAIKKMLNEIKSIG